MDTCARNQLKGEESGGTGRLTRRVSAANMPKAPSKEDAESLGTCMQTMSLEERERNAQEDIEEMEREERVALLEAKRDLLERRRAARVGTAGAGSVRLAMEAIQDGGGVSHPFPPTPTVTTGHSTYGTTRARRRSRSRRCHRSSSGSRSRSSSADRRKRSKWSLKRFTVGAKEVRKLNAYELMGASILWLLDIDDLNVVDYKAFLEHMHFMTVRAMHDDFKDSAHVEYDTAIRKMAESMGFAAFSKAQNGTSVLHYGAQNMRPKKHVASAGGARKAAPRVQDGKRSCFHWNREAGCPKTEDSCGFGHWCGKCGSKAHIRPKCSKD